MEWALYHMQRTALRRSDVRPEPRLGRHTLGLRG